MIAAILTLALSAAIGLYLTVAAGWVVALFAVIGGVTIVLYTPLLSRWGIGEAAAGLSLGSLVVAGTYYAMLAP